MFKIKYTLSSLYNTQDKFELFEEIDFHYNFLCGSLFLWNETLSIDIDWEWVPILDFAYFMMTIILDKNDATFEFTESDMTIKFKFEDGSVQINPCWLNEKSLVIPLIEFEEVVRDFYSDLLDYIKIKCPDAYENPNFSKFININ